MIAPLTGGDLFFLGLLALVALYLTLACVTGVSTRRTAARVRIAEAEARTAEALADMKPSRGDA